MAERKITFIGDIMCERLLLEAAKRKDGSYDYSTVFVNMKDMFSQADFVVGNLETPLAGEAAGYTSEMYSFNSPDEFANAVKCAGVDMVAIANNHCLDRGIEGLHRTIRALDDLGFAHCGTRVNGAENQEAAYFMLGDTKIAVINYTYGTNYALNKTLLPQDDLDILNLLRPQQEPVYLIRNQNKGQGKKSVVKRIIGRVMLKIPEEQRLKFRKLLKKPYNYARADDYLDECTITKYIERMQRDIAIAKTKADLVFFAPHIGGQFNLEPGAFSKYIVEKAHEAGCDAIIASHAHVVQRAEVKDGIPCFYSLGNFSISPSSAYLLYDHLPNYGLAVHIYVDDAAVKKVTFSVLKMVENKKKMVTVYPVDDLYLQLTDEREKEQLNACVAQIYSTVTGKTLMKNHIICREYVLIDNSLQGE